MRQRQPGRRRTGPCADRTEPLQSVAAQGKVPMRRCFRTSVVLGILLTLSLVFSSSASAYTTSSWENTVASHVNHYDRLPRGIAATRTNYTLSYYAHVHSAAMMSKGYLFHSTNLTSLVSSWS